MRESCVAEVAKVSGTNTSKPKDTSRVVRQVDPQVYTRSGPTNESICPTKTPEKLRIFGLSHWSRRNDREDRRILTERNEKIEGRKEGVRSVSGRTRSGGEVKMTFSRVKRIIAQNRDPTSSNTRHKELKDFVFYYSCQRDSNGSESNG
ncbi:hypothetical protein V1477_007877 [Vespula maculifrons]|uniref:Uncharacterized protein n=1 Tax=Vespula maculifrons TaxID=7453 RepID=A0ABD2CG57_VESMC